jgi:hypothetical protein
VGFRYAALVMDVWLGVVHWLHRFYHDRDAARTALREAWRALPGDALGMAVMRGCGVEAPTRIVQSGDVTAVMVEDPRVERWFRAHPMPVQAQTLGRYILARGPVPPDILAHEVEHIRQWSRFGPLYLPAYFGSSAAAWLQGRRFYWDNAFEAAARRRAELEMTGPRDAASS